MIRFAVICFIASISMSVHGDGYLWMSSEHAAPYSLYRFNLQTKVIDKVVTPTMEPTTRVYNNLTYEGLNLIIGTNATDLFAKLNPYSGYVRSIGSYAPTQSYPHYEDGAYDGVTNTLWRGGVRLVQTTTNGAILGSYPYNRNIIGLELVNGVMYGTDFDNFGVVTIQSGSVVLTALPVSGLPVGKLALAYDQVAGKLYMTGLNMQTQKQLLLEVDPVSMTSVVVADLSSVGFPTGFYEADAMAWIPKEPETWSARYDGPSHGYDVLNAMVVNQANCVYLAGSVATATGDDAGVVKFGPDGTTLWARLYNGIPNGSDANYGLALTADGGVVAVGRTDGTGTNWDLSVLRYSPDGALVWAAKYNNAARNGPDAALAVKLDATGNIYVSGHSEGSTGDPDYITIKYDPNGNELWNRRYHNTYRDVAPKIDLDPQGNVIVAGWSSSANGLDYVVIKYDTNGNQLWQTRYDGPGHWDDVLKGLCVDSSGAVYVSGRSWGDGISWDFGTVKYDSNGNQLWVQRVNANGPAPDEALDMKLTPDGVVVTGWTSPSNPDVYTIMYTRQGATRWIATHKSNPDMTDRGQAVATDPNGNVYVACRTGGLNGSLDYDALLLKYDRRGKLLGQYRYNGPVDGDDGGFFVTVGSDLSVYMAGTSTGDGTSVDWFVVKYPSYQLKPDGPQIP